LLWRARVQQKENYVGSETLLTSIKEKESPRALAPYDPSTSRKETKGVSGDW